MSSYKVCCTHLVLHVSSGWVQRLLAVGHQLGQLAASCDPFLLAGPSPEGSTESMWHVSAAMAGGTEQELLHDLFPAWELAAACYGRQLIHLFLMLLKGQVTGVIKMLHEGQVSNRLGLPGSLSSSALSSVVHHLLAVNNQSDNQRDAGTQHRALSPETSVYQMSWRRYSMPDLHRVPGISCCCDYFLFDILFPRPEVVVALNVLADADAVQFRLNLGL